MDIRSKIRPAVLAVSALAALAAGCAETPQLSERQKGTATGAAVGAVGGAVLSKATVNAGGMSSSNVTTTDQYRVSLVKRDKAAGALAHPGNTELLYITEGAGTVVTGGTLVPAAGGKPASILNGVTQKITKGDVIIVPAGSPHWFAAVDSPITYLEVRWLAPK